MARGESIVVRMVVSSAVLLVVVVGLFATLTRLQVRQVSESATQRLHQARDEVKQGVAKLRDAKERSGGLAALQAVEAALAKKGTGRDGEAGGLGALVLLGLLSVVLGVLLSVVQSLKVTRALSVLSEKAAEIAAGDLEARVEVASRDEIGRLGQQFNHMADQVGELMQEAMYKVIMEKELEVVSAVQSTLVPDDTEVALGSISLAGYFQPAAQCGGDWWDYFEIDHRILVIIGDVTGHGAPSAMITAAAKGAVTGIVDLRRNALQLSELLKAMNTTILDVAKGRFVMTCFAAIYDRTTGELQYANAGHIFPYLHQGRKLKPLIARGNRLGDVGESDFEVSTLTVEHGATLVWFTDGIVDGENPRGEKWGERRFRKRVEEYAGLPAGRARDELVARAYEHFGGVAPKDDITVVVGRFGQGEAAPEGN